MEDLYKKKLEELNKDVLKTLIGLVKLVLQKTGDDEMMLGEFDMSAPIHAPNEDGNLAQTISSIKLEDGELKFVIDASYTDFELGSEDISTENLIALIGISEEIGKQVYEENV